MGKAAIRIGTAVAAFAIAAAGAPALAGSADGGRAAPRAITPLDGPRGVDALGGGRTLVTETGGDFSLVVERRNKPARVVHLGNLESEFPPAIAKGRRGTIYLLTGASGPPPEERSVGLRGSAPAAATTLFKWKRGWPAPKPVANIAAYQATDQDPWDQENHPADSNPFGLAALADGTVLVADAAGNDLLRVWPRTGKIRTVARLMPRTVAVPPGLPDIPPEMGGPLPPAGTPIVSEAVATSVAVGDDGFWYVGELRGFPATPGTSQVWRIKPGTKNATCDPVHPRRGPCKRYADGFTSITDLAAGEKGIYALELSKKSWFAFELGLPGAQEGGLFLIRDRGSKPRVRELAAGHLMIPGGVDVDGRRVYVVGPLFGPGALLRVR